MATRSKFTYEPAPTLERARKRASQSSARLKSLQNGEISIKPSGGASGGGSGQSSGGGGGEGPARSLRGTAADFDLVEGRDSDWMKLLKGRVPKQKKARQNVEEKGRGRSDVRVPDHHIPVAREQRLSTPDGRTSFHFSHEAISKTRRETVSETGVVNRPGAAKAHQVYIEREAAVATISDEKTKEDSAELALTSDPNDGLGGAVNAIENIVSATQKENNASAVSDAKKLSDQVSYIERQEAMARQPNGDLVLFTSMDPDQKQRSITLEKIEAFEREPGPDKMSFRIADDEAFWRKTAAAKGCPPALKEAVEAANPIDKVSVTLDSGETMRRFLSTQDGYRPTPKKEAGESAESYAERKENAHAKFHDGRGGRIQFRITAELPHELDTVGRASILRTFCDEFESRKLPYIGVMHAPDHTNNDKNWHFHLVYYDRPIRRVTQEEIDAYVAAKGRKAEPMVAGQWDFEIQDREHDTKNGNNRIIYPFRQQKNRDAVRSKEWIDQLRNRLAEITNDHLERASVERRLDPRRHSEMGIHADPQEHLGTRLANLEAMGIATPKGVANEDRQWAAIMARLDQDLEKKARDADQEAERYMAKIERSPMNAASKTNVRADVIRWHQCQTEADEQGSIAERIGQHMERTLSRANKVKQTCDKHLAAIADGKATKYLSIGTATGTGIGM